MSEIRGDTTMVIRGKSNAGTWKQIDLPPPVGRTITASRRESTASIAGRCGARKSS